MATDRKTSDKSNEMTAILISDEVTNGLTSSHPIVALESTLISHGLPAPDNLEVAKDTEKIIRENGGIPATIAVIEGKIRIGLTNNELELLATSDSVEKLSRNNLATAIAKNMTGATTVAATMICARRAGISIFATGGIGGVHRNWQESFDISADLSELMRTPLTIVCSGAKSILDLPATMEYLETIGVPIIGLGTNELPAFFSSKSGIELKQTVNDSKEAAAIIHERRNIELEGGEIIAVPPPEDTTLPPSAVRPWIEAALNNAQNKNIKGSKITPFVLDQLHALSNGQTLKTNISLIKNNAKIATQIAKDLLNKNM